MKLPRAMASNTPTCTASWITLLALTTITFALGARAPGHALMPVVLALTLFKGQLVASNFMGLCRVRLLWRVVMGAYLAAVGGAIAVAYFIA